MAEPVGFSCSVVTPDRVVIECDARFAAVPAHDGEIGILRQRAPLLTRLGVGRLRIDKSDGGEELFLVDGGFAEMVDNRLTVLTESAMRPDEIRREDAERLLAEAREMTALDDVANAARQRAFDRARAQLRLIGSRSGER